MKTIKVSEATPIQLDWLVAKCEKRPLSQASITSMLDRYGHLQLAHGGDYSPTTSWTQSGPIIDQEKILFGPAANQRIAADMRRTGTSGVMGFGETHLIAAMRCYVASKLGEEVEVPKELL